MLAPLHKQSLPIEDFLAAVLSGIVSYFLVIVIFYCADTTALHMPDWNFSEGGR